MKRLLLILFCLPLLGFGQKTYVPDDNFETYLETNNLGDGITLNDSVLSSNIFSEDTLMLNPGLGYPISDLTGIEGFSSLIYLQCYNIELSFLDVTQNTFLQHLEIPYNQLNSLDVCQNILLQKLECEENNISFLDLTNNSDLVSLNCENNGILSLDLRNGNNNYMIRINIETNFNLTCVNVDDSIYSTNNWNGSGTNINGQSISSEFDPQHYFSNNCSGTTSIQQYSLKKKILKVTDLLGRETKGTRNEPLFYTYDDGTVEKKIIIE